MCFGTIIEASIFSRPTSLGLSAVERMRVRSSCNFRFAHCPVCDTRPVPSGWGTAVVHQILTGYRFQKRAGN